MIIKISTWIQLAALAVVIIYLALSAPPSFDRSVTIIGLLIVLGLIVVLDRNRATGIERLSRWRGALEAYNNLIDEYDTRARDPSDPLRDCLKSIAQELRRTRDSLKRIAKL